MYTGTNPSAIRSQKWLTESLLHLMEEKSYKKISIKEISERSDLARQTFYQLFNSKEEILEYHLDNLFNNYLDEIRNLKIPSIYELARLYFIFFDNNDKFIDQLIQNDLISILNRKFYFYLNEISHVLNQDQNEIFNNYALAFISSGLVGILVYWFNENRNLTIDQLALLVGKLLNDNYLN